MNKYQKLVKNIVTFAAGNLGSKVITFLMLPFYTHLLSTKEYGQIDLITTTLSLVLPLITLNLIESIFRFSIDDKDNRKSVFTSVIITCIILYSTSIIPYFLLNIDIFGNDYNFLFINILFLSIIHNLLKQFIRALQKLYIYMFSDLINTIIFVILNFVFIGKFALGINGYLYSMIIAYFIDCIYLIIGGKVWKYFNIKQFNISLLNEMIKYSAPLIPNALMWWIINISDRYLVSYFLGVDSNGIYSAAAKFPSIIYMLYLVFNKGWQISALEENDSKNKEYFYSKVFNIISFILILCASIYISLNKIIMKIMLSAEFFIAWKYTPFLVLGVLFSSFASFLGINYIASKRTKGAFISSLIAALSNFSFNLLLIPLLGIQGASLSTAISFFIMFIVRILDTKKYTAIEFNKSKFSLSILLLIVQILLNIFELEYVIGFNFFIVILILIINTYIIKELISTVKRLLNKKLLFKKL